MGAALEPGAAAEAVSIQRAEAVAGPWSACSAVLNTPESQLPRLGETYMHQLDSTQWTPGVITGHSLVRQMPDTHNTHPKQHSKGARHWCALNRTEHSLG